MAGKQMVFEVSRPLLLLVFLQKAQFAKMMSIAQGMFTLGVLRIAAVAIVFNHSVKLGQDADHIGGDLASLAMTGVVGECFRPCRVQPMQHPLHSHPRLIGSYHFCGTQGLLDLLFRLDESVCCFCDALLLNS